MNENIKTILSSYEELKGILKSISDERTWFDDDGFSKHTNSVIERIGKICPEIEDIDSYKVVNTYSDQRGALVQVIQTKSRINALLGRMNGAYELEKPNSNNGNIFVQNQSQSQSQTLSIVLEIQEKIIKEMPNYEEGSKERTFLEKIKENLSTIKDVKDILSIILSVGAEVGLSLVTIKEILGL